MIILFRNTTREYIFALIVLDIIVMVAIMLTEL